MDDTIYIELKGKIRRNYTKKEKDELEERRKHNILSFRTFIKAERAKLNEAINQQDGKNTKLCITLYTTIAGEKICIRFPGKEAERNGENKRDYDFKPIIITSDGKTTKDLSFSDMWDILDIVKESERASNILTAIFFSMGHMLYHTQDTIQAPESKKVILDTKTDKEGNKYEDILSEEPWTATKITWFRLHIDEDVLKALNNEIGTIVLSDGKRISLEAFLYFYDLLMLNEDIKYNYSAVDDKDVQKIKERKNKAVKLSTSGRIPTSNSLLMILLTHIEQTKNKPALKMSLCLQKLVNGRGVIHCSQKDYSFIPDNLISFIDDNSLLHRIIELLESFNVPRNQIKGEGRITIQVEKKKYAVKIKFIYKNCNIAVLSHNHNQQYTVEQVKEALKKKDWHVYYLDEYEEIKELLEKLQSES